MLSVSERSRLSRRQLLAGGLALVGAGAGGAALWPLRHGIRAAMFGASVPATPTPLPYPTETPRAAGSTWPWLVAPNNPVLDVVPSSGWENAAVYDPCVVRLADGSLRMWYSTRGSRPASIALAIDSTGTGDHWARLRAEPVLTPEPHEALPYTSITRPSVVALPDGTWRMWYSTQGATGAAGAAWIGMADSADGITWRKHGQPVLMARDPWEKRALQCPNVRFDTASGLFQMWYCGGDEYEPDAVGFATSANGVDWTRSPMNPVYLPGTGWEDYKTGSFQVHRVGDWYYAFYNAFQRSPFVSRVGMARSRDGVSGWERHPANPLFSPGPPGSWNARMVYKPTALWNEHGHRWDVWFNASMILNKIERIGHAWSDRVW